MFTPARYAAGHGLETVIFFLYFFLFCLECIYAVEVVCMMRIVWCNINHPSALVPFYDPLPQVVQNQATQYGSFYWYMFYLSYLKIIPITFIVPGVQAGLRSGTTYVIALSLLGIILIFEFVRAAIITVANFDPFYYIFAATEVSPYVQGQRNDYINILMWLAFTDIALELIMGVLILAERYIAQDLVKREAENGAIIISDSGIPGVGAKMKPVPMRSDVRSLIEGKTDGYGD